MQKKGQIFVLAALLLGFIIFILVSETQYTRKTIQDYSFEDLNKNYQIESAKFINELIKDPSLDVGSEFLGFTTLFTSYSKSQNPDFQLVYAFDFNGKLHVGNYLKEKIDIDTPVPTKTKADLSGCFEEIEAKLAAFGLNIAVSGIENKVSACYWDERIYDEGKGVDSYPIAIKIGDDDFWYGIDIEVGVPELIVVSREERDGERKVFTKGRFLKGKELEELQENV